ncbi:MAG: glycerophosphodiester phosphodiesterase family protein [Christensenellales bacterium]|jgi:glycerophosphoryl diester phosphodiesterase
MPFLIAAAALAALMLLYLFLIKPGPNDGRMGLFLGRCYAHRGLHDEAAGIPENSLAAFAAAADAGYGMELDVHLTKDGKLAVFHDDTLLRMCGVQGEIKDSTLAELQALTLAGTNQPIPALDELLRLVDGRVPLIIEIKGQSMNPEACRHVHAALQGYPGAYVIESFNPIYLRWWRKNAPEVLRGQLSANLLKEGAKDMRDRVQRWAVKHLLTNFLTRPDFIAYDHRDEGSLSFRLCRSFFKAVTVFWTIQDEATFQRVKGRCDAVIFEGFLPPKEFETCAGRRIRPDCVFADAFE